ncbi:MAG: hypothetical protein M1814_005824 [Vezdaea aestivalis]|nr:MAG: hypothetical protein M1814_005824 [Vezdaea aestivalis]
MRSIFKPPSPLLPTHSASGSNPSTPSSTQPHSPSIPAPVLSSRHAPSQSAFLSTQPARPTTPTLSALRRRSSHLQGNLQQLLDAQSDGLLISLGRSAFRGSSNGSNTPTASVSASSAPGRSQITSRSQGREIGGQAGTTIGLKGARKGILSCMRELTEIKGLEAELLAVERQAVGEVVGRIQAWIGKRNGLDREIETMKKEKDSPDLSALEKTNKDLGKEINDVQSLLDQLKTKQKIVRREIEEIRNGIDARMSSFTVSREIVDKQVKLFLKNPPQPIESMTMEARAIEEGFTALSVGGRTLEMAEVHYQKMDEALKQSIGNASTERAALKSGVQVWKDVITSVGAFEKLLRTTISKSQQVEAALLVEAPSSSSAEADTSLGSHTDEMKSLLKAMDATFEQIAEKLHLADTNGWNLLVCAIGAELEAFREGRELLIAHFGGGVQVAQEGHAKPKEAESNPNDPTRVEISDTQPQEKVGEKVTVEGCLIDDRSESDDDGPGPDLLYERRDEEE